jgi:glucose-6-phosphate dehydrogenase assembly protein OpcA
MTIQQIVSPEKIEPELNRIWEKLAKEKMRACLFNLIVFNRLSKRTDYIRDIVQKVSEKYPCRVLFITSDPDAEHSYLKTAVSIVGNGNIACEYIDIGVSGSCLEKVPFLLLPHIIPDLPVSLLWTEDPTLSHPLFKPLVKLANRLIFDSESADSLFEFSKVVLDLRKKEGKDTADLNWARTEGWRDLIASLFHSEERLDKINQIKITYNTKGSDFFCHLKVQSLYLISWLASRLNWNFKKASSNLEFQFGEKKAMIYEDVWEKLGPGTVISVDIETVDGHLHKCTRIPAQYHTVNIQASSPEKCELPFQFILGRTATGQSLIKEIITKGTSEHYLNMLEELKNLDRDRLC